MNTEILELLHQNREYKDWKKVENKLKPLIVDYINGEPVYGFYETLKDKSLNKNGQLISISTQPVDSFVPYHIHNYVEMMVVLLGNCTIRTASNTIHMKQDEIIVMGRDTIHKVDEIDSGTIVVNIALKPAAFSLNDLDFLTHKEGMQSISSMLFSLLASNNSKVAFNLFHTNHESHVVNTVYDIISEYYQPDSFSNQIIKMEVLELFLRLIRIASHSPNLVNARKKQNNNEIDLLTLLLYIEKNYKLITLDKMAAYFGFNANYLSAYLKKRTGYTFIKLVHIQRINVAAEYLTFSNAPIDNISTEVGYENPSYFYKVFKKYIGCSPSDYRKKYQKN